MNPLDEIDDILGIDPKDPDVMLAERLTEEHLALVEELVRMRDRAGLSQEHVAERMGVTQPTISAFEKLGKDVRLSTIRRYALAVGAMVKHRVEPFVADHTDDGEDNVVWASMRFQGQGWSSSSLPEYRERHVL